MFLLLNKNTSHLSKGKYFPAPWWASLGCRFPGSDGEGCSVLLSPIHHWEAFPGTLDGQWILRFTSRLSYYSTIQLALIIMTHNLSSHFKACLNSWLHLILMTTETSIIIIILTLQMYLFNKHLLKYHPVVCWWQTLSLRLSLWRPKQDSNSRSSFYSRCPHSHYSVHFFSPLFIVNWVNYQVLALCCWLFHVCTFLSAQTWQRFIKNKGPYNFSLLVVNNILKKYEY